MTAIPRLRSLESTLAMRRDPYGFISRHSRALGSDVFEARILAKRTICMVGPEAAKLFYDASRFQRHGAPPQPIRNTLLGNGGVQGLDDEAHRHRKAMFMSILTPQAVEELRRITGGWWRHFIGRWQDMDDVVLYDELHELLTRAVCQWAGVPLDEAEVPRRTHDLSEMFDAAGAFGPRHLLARFGRLQANAWMRKVIHGIRQGEIRSPEGSPAHVLASHRDLQGRLLDQHAAAVDLLNLLRPTVAVSVWIVLAATALHENPSWRDRLREGSDDQADRFVQEVRRFYPFFPAAVARVRHDFQWNGYEFAKGRRVLLDLYGTNHDERTYERPERFDPERFARNDPGLFAFIPHGGGDAHVTHRCPGESVAVELTKQALHIMTRQMQCSIPDQDLRINHQRLPALPRSGFVLRSVQRLD